MKRLTENKIGNFYPLKIKTTPETDTNKNYDGFYACLEAVNRLGEIEDILGVEYNLDRLKELVQADRELSEIIKTIKEQSEKQESEEVKMDAVEFLKTQRRICEEYEAGVCTDCPFDNGNELCSFYTDDEEEVVRKAKEWSKQHPKIELTEQQITAVKGRIAEGARWAFKNNIELGYVFFTDTKPYIDDNILFVFNKDNAKYTSTCNDDFYNFVTFENSPISLIELLRELG